MLTETNLVLADEGLDWFARMHPAVAAEQRAAAEGRAAFAAYLAAAEYDPSMFTPADHAALAGAWSWMLTVVNKAMETDRGGEIDDGLSGVAWGCDPTLATAPVLFVHGSEDRVIPAAHSQWLAAHCPASELWQRPGEGHVSVLGAGVEMLDWLRDREAGP